MKIPRYMQLKIGSVNRHLGQADKLANEVMSWLEKKFGEEKWNDLWREGSDIYFQLGDYDVGESVGATLDALITHIQEEIGEH
jgi:hypothetical protein